MLTINDAGMPAGFIPLPHAVEARYTVSNVADQPTFAGARAGAQLWMTDPARQVGDSHLIRCDSVDLRYGDARRLLRPRPMH